MVAMTVSSAVLLMSMWLLQAARDNFLHHHQSLLFQDGAGFVFEVIERTLQQATRAPSQPDRLPGPVSADTFTSSPPRTAPPWPPRTDQGSIQGFDNARLSGDADDVGTLITPGLRGSDMLWVNLGSTPGITINCAGFERSGDALDKSEHGWVIIHLVPGIAGESDLHCRYRGQKKWESQAILSGVESFQVLYGLDADEDGLPNQYLNAGSISAQQTGQHGAAGSPWHQVVAVHIAMVLRAADGGKPAPFQPIDLFGSDYADTAAGTDPGTRLRYEDLSEADRHRIRYRTDRIIFLKQPHPAS